MRSHRILTAALLLPIALALPPACAADRPPAGAEVTAFQQDAAAGLKGWETSSGQWTAIHGRLAVRNPDTEVNALATPRRAPLLDTQTVEATVRVTERLALSGWSLAGIVIELTPNDFWLLSLTQDDGGKRYVDFLENTRGIWQAQTADGPTRLATVTAGGTLTPWIPDHDYRMKIDLNPDGISAAVTDAGSGEVIATRSFPFGTATAVREGTVALLDRGCAAEYADVSVKAPASVLAAPAGIHIESGPRGSVGLLRDSLPGLDLHTVDSLAARLRKAGFGVTFLSAQNVRDPAVLEPERFTLYAVTNAAVYPADGARALMGYLRRGGRLLLLGGPPFSRPIWQRAGEWLDAATVRSRLEKLKPEHVLLDFSPGQDLTGWVRATNDPTIASSVSIDPAGPEGTGASLKIAMHNLTGWNTYASPAIDGKILQGQDLITFWAKGDAATPQLSLEMDEQDGSRWIAVVALTTRWKYHVLRPGDFKYWQDSKTTAARGGPGDRFNPQQAARLVVGLAQSHTHEVGPGHHTLWVARFGTAADPYAGLIQPSQDTLFPIETVTPSYKLYPLHDIHRMDAAPDQTILPAGLRLPAPGPAFSCIERPMGRGFDNHAHWRWIPLLRALDAEGKQRGTTAWMLLNEALPFQGSAIAVFGIQDQTLFQGDALGSAVIDAAKSLSQGVFLTEGGSREFSYWPGEQVELGASAVDWGSRAASLRVRFAVTAKNGRLFEAEAPLNLGAGDTGTVTRTWNPGAQPGDSEVNVELIQGTQVVDRIRHEIGFLHAGKPAASNFVSVRGSEFLVHGKQWNPVGVNFWPFCVSGLEPGDYSGHWLSRGFYDPEEVDRDLDRVAALGMNMVSVQLGDAANIRNTLDFLRQCDRHGIKVNGFLSGASPLDFNEAQARDTIRAGRLDENTALFAYDTIWEPGNSVFNAQGRPRWDRDWETWIISRYGSLEAAEADSGMAVPRAEGRVTSPSDRQLSQDGPWRVMVAAYRRFMTDIISRKWNDASRRLRALDPHHLISFRQGNTLPWDFALTGPVKHIDFISPEGYSIPPGERGYDAAAFTTRYVHFTTGGKPVFWAEFGQSVWDGDRMQPDPTAFTRQANYIELFLRQAMDAGANGLAPWWWPGGYRVDERSDFGIMNPDGTPRPAAQIVARYAPGLEAPPTYPTPDTWLTIDPDTHAGGYWWIIFHQGADAYARAHAVGHILGVRTAGTGTNSATTPLIAVGNRPYNGHNPLKYLDAEFNWLEIQGADGKWIDVQNGATIPVAPGKAIRARVSVGNLQEAAWLTPASAHARPGAVYLAAGQGSGLAFRKPIPRDTPRFGDADFGEFELSPGVTTSTPVVLQMMADGRGTFGEKREFSLAPGG